MGAGFRFLKQRRIKLLNSATLRLCLKVYTSWGFVWITRSGAWNSIKIWRQSLWSTTLIICWTSGFRYPDLLVVGITSCRYLWRSLWSTVNETLINSKSKFFCANAVSKLVRLSLCQQSWYPSYVKSEFWNFPSWFKSNFWSVWNKSGSRPYWGRLQRRRTGTDKKCRDETPSSFVWSSPVPNEWAETEGWTKNERQIGVRAMGSWAQKADFFTQIE